ncbi:SPOR domain-containing protein [Bacteroidia bacterium]|nr:SPOR domain-containing protein [Bacteroidia bacterium]MDB9882071.1 SPOR domain-containing protein [Bacteroidia bacterium]
MNFLKWLLYLIALGAFIWFVFFKKLNTNTSIVDTNNTEVNDDGSISNPDADLNTEEEIDYTVDNGTDATSDNQYEVTSTGQVNTTNGVNLDSKYLIVVGSFGKKSNAEKMKTRVSEKFKYATITVVNGLHRVVAASSDDQDDAQNLRDHFTHIFKEPAFILEQ